MSRRVRLGFRRQVISELRPSPFLRNPFPELTHQVAQNVERGGGFQTGDHRSFEVAEGEQALSTRCGKGEKGES